MAVTELVINAVDLTPSQREVMDHFITPDPLRVVKYRFPGDLVDDVYKAQLNALRNPLERSKKRTEIVGFVDRTRRQFQPHNATRLARCNIERISNARRSQHHAVAQRMRLDKVH